MGRITIVSGPKRIFLVPKKDLVGQVRARQRRERRLPLDDPDRLREPEARIAVGDDLRSAAAAALIEEYGLANAAPAARP